MTPGFIIANCLAPIIFLDSLVRGTALATTSARGKREAKRIGPVQLFDERRSLENLRVGGKDAHAECGGPAGDLAADTAQGDDQERLARQLIEHDARARSSATLLSTECARSASDCG